MPFIVTTRREGRLPGREHDAVWSRRAVATLEEAQAAGAMELRRHEAGESFIPFLVALSESGGTVGPLPDGTVIEVMAVDDEEYARAIDAGMNGPPVRGVAADGDGMTVIERCSCGKPLNDCEQTIAALIREREAWRARAMDSRNSVLRDRLEEAVAENDRLRADRDEWQQAAGAEAEAADEARRQLRGAVGETVWLRSQMGDVRGMQSDGATPEEMDHALGRALSGERARLDFDRERGQ